MNVKDGDIISVIIASLINQGVYTMINVYAIRIIMIMVPYHVKVNLTYIY
jgi:hypothetical protein